MHNVIWKEHDGSWTWSIEEGEAFEKDHQVLARDEGFHTRGDAKEAMQKEWARLIDEGKTPGRPGQLAPPSAEGEAAGAKPTPAKSKKTERQAAPGNNAQPEWAVVANGQIVAVFVDQKLAKKFGKDNYKGKHEVQRVVYGISLA